MSVIARKYNIKVIHEYHHSDDGRHRVSILWGFDTHHAVGDWAPYNEAAHLDSAELGLMLVCFTAYHAGAGIKPDTPYNLTEIVPESTMIQNPPRRPRG